MAQMGDPVQQFSSMKLACELSQANLIIFLPPVLSAGTNHFYLFSLPMYPVPSVIQGQSVMTQPVKLCRENELSTLTSGNDGPVPLTVGGDPDTQDPFWSQ